MKVDQTKIKDTTKKVQKKTKQLATDKNAVAETFANVITFYMKRNLTLANNIHTGELIRSIKVKYDENYERWDILMAKQWKYIEFGTDPYSAPTNERIISWVKDKYIPYKSGKKTLPQALYLFIDHIRKFGLQPYPFARRSIIDAKRKIEDEISTKLKGKVIIRER